MVVRLLQGFDPPISPANLHQQPYPWLQGDKPMNTFQRLLIRPAVRIASSIAVVVLLIASYAVFDARTVSAGEVLDNARRQTAANANLRYRGVMTGAGLDLDGASIAVAVDGDKARMEVCRPAATGCHIRITTPQFQWSYDPGLHVAERLETASSIQNDGVTGGLFGALSLESMLAAADQHAEAELEASETVAGRAAYVLTITPDETPDRRVRFWVDQEHFILLRADMVGPDNVTLSSSGYSHIEFNPEFEPGLFDFIPPAGTAVTCRRSLTVAHPAGAGVTISRPIDPATGQVIAEDPEVACPAFPTQP
ncbi:MAG TPA: sigma-E factor regulatory protein RseB domain-containing protein [Herpetosiphonaceae bacterium]|nr:sigma-E factor regulatory protein RseB domain-containing protein [Herpetosiphonaceae bacterium]